MVFLLEISVYLEGMKVDARCTQHYCWCTQHLMVKVKNAPVYFLKTFVHISLFFFRQSPSSTSWVSFFRELSLLLPRAWVSVRLLRLCLLLPFFVSIIGGIIMVVFLFRQNVRGGFSLSVGRTLRCSTIEVSLLSLCLCRSASIFACHWDVVDPHRI